MGMGLLQHSSVKVNVYDATVAHFTQTAFFKKLFPVNENSSEENSSEFPLPF